MSGACGRGIVDADDDREGFLAVAVAVRITFFCLVLFETIGAQAQAQRELRGGARVPGLRRRFENRGGLLALAQLTRHEASENGEIERLGILARRDADDEQPRGLEAGGLQNIECSERLAFESGRLGRGFDPGREITQQRAGPLPRLQIGAHENDEGSSAGGRDRAESDLGDFVHGAPREGRKARGGKFRRRNKK